MTVLLFGCASVPPNIIVAENRSTISRDPLTVKFDQVSLIRIRMVTALDLLSNAIGSSVSAHSNFVWYGPRFYDLRRMEQMSNPLVSLNKSNITLRVVLDELCAQSGWTYQRGTKGINFAIKGDNMNPRANQ